MSVWVGLIVASQVGTECGQRDVRVLLTELRICSTTRNLKRGKDIHAEAILNGHDSSFYVASTLVNMYAKCGCMIEAQRVFDTIKEPDVVSWTSLITGYAENGEGGVALGLFASMKSRGCAPDSFTFVAALKACTSLGLKLNRKEEFINFGKQIHSEIGSHLNIYVQNTLIDMYAKCGNTIEALKVFEMIKHPTLVSWTALILGYAENGEGTMALKYFERMKSEGHAPNSYTIVAALKACTSLPLNSSPLERVRDIHLEIGNRLNAYVQNTLIRVYTKLGAMREARKVFESMKDPDVASWTAVILGYAENGDGNTALDIFERMRVQGCTPDHVTFSAVLKACTSLVDTSECLMRGKQLHSEIGFPPNIVVQNSLIDMYCRCGCMVEASQIFHNMKHPDLVSWTTMVNGYADHGEGETALELFSRMSYTPNHLTFVAALKACISLKCLESGIGIHLQIGCHLDVYVETTLIDMYSKCRSIMDAHKVFDRIDNPGVVPWTALILGYAENGEDVTALNLFARMKSQGCVPDSLTYIAVLKACSFLGDLDSGRKIHAEMDTNDPKAVTCLVDFYVKCGSIVEAQNVFISHNALGRLESWNALLGGYSSLGDYDAVFKLFEIMKSKVDPNGVTFLCILACCSHVGLVEEAVKFFDEMSTRNGVTRNVEHYNCMFDVLGRSGKLDEAMSLLWSMPWRQTPVTWLTILGACRKWKMVAMGRMAFACLVNLDDKYHSGAAFALMTQIYTDASAKANIEKQGQSLEGSRENDLERSYTFSHN